MNFAPLSSKFTLVSILGLVISVFYIYPELGVDWGFTFSLMFMVFIIASIISTIYASSTALLEIEPNSSRDKLYGTGILKTTTVPKQKAPKKKTVKKAKRKKKSAKKKKKTKKT